MLVEIIECDEDKEAHGGSLRGGIPSGIQEKKNLEKEKMGEKERESMRSSSVSPNWLSRLSDLMRWWMQ